MFRRLMRSDPTIPTEAIETWLLANAWELVRRDARVAIYRQPSEDGDYVIDLPLDPSFGDFRRRMREVLDTLEVAAGRPRSVLVTEMEEASTARVTDFELEGSVVALESFDPDTGGHATVLGSVDGRPRRVRVHLEPEDYKLAIRAHDERVLLRCEGELAKRGTRFELDHARHVQLVAGED